MEEIFDLTYTVTHMSLMPVDLTDADPGNFCSEINIDLELLLTDDTRRKIGAARLLKIDFATAFECEWNIHEVLDATSEDASMFIPYFEENGEIDCDALEPFQWEPMCATHFLLFDRIDLDSEFRGKGFGLKFMQALIRQFSQYGDIVGLIVSDPKLLSHYSKIGFRQTPDGKRNMLLNHAYSPINLVCHHYNN